MDTLIFSLNAVLPIIIPVLLGYILRQKNVLTDDFIKTGNYFVFTYCFPCLMFVNVYSIQEFNAIYRDIAIFSSISIILLILLGLIWTLLFIRDPRQKGVMIQAFYRSNFAIIGVPLAASLYGSGSDPVTAIVLACTIPLYNASAVVFLTIFIKDSHHKISAGTIAYRIITNPLIEGILAALLCLIIRPYMHGWTLKSGGLRFIYKTIESISKITTPFALIILGGQFRFSATKKLLPKISAGVFAKIVLAPVLGLTAAHFFCPQFKGPEYAALLALFGSPIAVASAIMANQMDNDGELAGQILVWTTLLSAVTIFCFVSFFRSIGIF
jgi:malate permease and related proteins